MLNLFSKSRLLILAVSCALAVDAGSAPVKWRVSDPVLARSLIAGGGKLVADYGAFQWMETDDAAPTNFNSRGITRETDADEIKLNAGILNTRAASVQALRKRAGNFSGSELRLVQFAGPVKPAWRAALARTGVRIVSYIPENGFLIYGDSAAVGRMQNWAATNELVQWEGPYASDYKIHPAARRVDANGNPRAIGTDTFAVQMVAAPPANAATLALIAQWQRGAIQSDFSLTGCRTIVVRVPPERLPDIAARPDVISILPRFTPRKLDERQDQIQAGNLSGNLPSGPGYLAWLAGKGFTPAQFTASGFAVDVSDSGIDNGTSTPGHFGLYTLGDPSQASRVVYDRLVGTPNPGSTLAGTDGHGALNAHIIAGYDNGTNAFPHTDAAGYAYGLGVCPFVKIGASVVFDPDNWTNPNYTNLLTQAYAGGARISNNSWGAPGSDGVYDSDAQAYDALVRDVGAAGQNRPMVIVFAAGNDGPGGTTIESPGSAKNVITVGAAENVRSLTPANGGNDAAGSDGCGYTDVSADSANDLAGFSSRGPCADGRMKPDLVAPGTHITGGVPQISPPPSPAGLGTAIASFTSGDVCALPGSGAAGNTNNFFPLGQQFYTVSTGTSHATPAVAGACALVRQFFINHSNAPPSPAMTKAFLMNSARYLTGAGANDTLWSPNQGMGEADLGMAFDGAWRILRDQLAVEKFTAPGQTRSYSGTVPDPAKPFRVTLAWTDAPGSTTASKALVNDLDLTVTAGGNFYRGNVFNGAYSTTGGAADNLNNVESVFLPAGTATNFTVTVTAASINADALTNGGTLPEQDYALVIYNAQIAQPTAQAISVSNKLVTMKWNVPVNFNYRVQFKTNLADASWTDLTTDMLATNSLATVTNATSGAARFYRVRVAQ